MLLWELVRSISGLNNIALLNARYLTKSSILTPNDINYNDFFADAGKIIEEIKKKNPEVIQEVEEIVKKLGIKATGEYLLDTYYGQLVTYEWHNTEIEEGANYTPIYHLISELKKTIPTKSQKLDAIRRRFLYIE
ncbi:MAG: hypothetical protein ACTSQG_09205, partial [Promethearchaeota archaeon]